MFALIQDTSAPEKPHPACSQHRAVEFEIATNCRVMGLLNSTVTPGSHRITEPFAAIRSNKRLRALAPGALGVLGPLVPIAICPNALIRDWRQWSLLLWSLVGWPILGASTCQPSSDS